MTFLNMMIFSPQVFTIANIIIVTLIMLQSSTFLCMPSFVIHMLHAIAIVSDIVESPQDF